MTAHRIGTREEWLASRLDLLEAEKELTRHSDELAERRRQLPWVRIEKEYTFDTEDGNRTFKELFRGRSQLLVYHFMFGTEYAAGCPLCSSIADGFNGVAVHLSQHDVMFCAISRAPIAKLLAYRERMGWTFPWASSGASEFNSDFSVGFSENQQVEGAVEYNYSREGKFVWRPEAESGGEQAVAKIAGMCGVDVATYLRERPGMSAFALENGVVHHSYSAYSRGIDALWGMYPWLDRSSKGRNEEGIWWRRHDEYVDNAASSLAKSCCVETHKGGDR